MSQLRISDKPVRNKVFISYSHQDKTWFDKVMTHLKPLVRGGQLDIWEDTQIKAGQDWQAKINQALEVTKVGLLIISPNFFASDYIISHELPILLDAAKKEGAVILSLIVSASLFQDTPELYKYQALNSPSKPLDKMNKSNQNSELVKVTQTIKHILDS